jgi:hypothetical protein
MIGRNTSGGLVIALRPLTAATGVALGDGLGLPPGVAEGDSVGDGEAEGDAEGEADGDGEADSVNVAHGLGATLAQSLCAPGGSPANGFTCVVKLPLELAVAEPATLL